MNITNDSLVRLFDENTFVEIGACRGSGVTCGYGSVNTALTFAFAQDSTAESGAIGEAEARKICELYALAEKSGAPIVGIFDGAGARITEGAGALDAFGKILGAVSGISGKLPQIAIIKGVCAGMSAVAASMFDFTVAVEGALFYINPPTVQRAGGAGKDAGSVSAAYKSGIIDLVYPDFDSAVDAVRDRLLSMIPQNNTERSCSAYMDAPERDTSGLQVCRSMTEIIDTLTDIGSFVELKAGCVPELKIGLASFDTLVAGVVATEQGSTLTPAALRKAASFISYCDNYSLPVVTLVDSTGIDRSVDSENNALSSELARVAQAYSSSTGAKITLVTGKAYGAAFTLLGSKSVGADIVYALPDAEISVMDPDAAVQFLYGEEIKASDDPAAKRAELTKEWKEANTTAGAAAAAGLIDNIIDYCEARAKLTSALYTLWNKAQGDVYRKHTKLPF